MYFRFASIFTLKLTKRLTQIYLGKWFLLQPFWFFLLILNIPVTLRWCFSPEASNSIGAINIWDKQHKIRVECGLFFLIAIWKETGVSDRWWVVYRECLHREIKIVFPHSVDISLDKNDAPIKMVYRMFMHVGIANFYKHKTKIIKR